MSDDQTSAAATEDLIGAPIVPLAAAVLVASGFVGLLTAGQALYNLEIAGPGRLVPWAQAALSAAAIYVAASLAGSSHRAAVAGASLGFLGAAVSAGWLVFGVLNGFYSLIALLCPPLTLLAAILCGASVGPTRRYQRARAALMASDGGVMFGTPDADGPWGVAVLGTSILVSPLLLMLGAPTVADRLWLSAVALSRGVWPSVAGVSSSRHDDFRYPWSPFEHYLAVEAEHHPLDVARATAWVDDVAAEVGLRMLWETGARDVDAAERALSEADRDKDVSTWIAAALRDRGVFYHPESLMSRSFDPDRHRPGAEVHLDCDQLVYVFAHVAWRLDLDVRVVPAAMHAYVQYRPPDDPEGAPLVVEATSFRDDVEDARGRMHTLLGSDFFVPQDWHRSGKGGTWASRALSDAAHLYEPATADQVHDMIVSEVAVGLKREDPDRDVRPMLQAEVDDTLVPELVGNLHAWTMAAAREALERGDHEGAIREASAAARLRATRGPLLSLREPTEATVLVTALAASGRGEEALEVGRAALRLYRDALGRDPWEARTGAHEALLEAVAAAGLPVGGALDR